MVRKNEYKLSAKDRCVGNHLAKRRPLLKKAIKKTGASVYIKDVATDSRDRVIPGCISVWTTETNLSSFWAVYKRLVAESEGDKE